MAAKKKTRAGTSKPRPSNTSGRSGTTEVDLHLDATLARRWKESLKVLLAARRGGASAFDDLWETVATIVDHDPPLYLAGGYATFRAFLAAYLEESERTARRMIRVARHASPAEEARYGISKIDAALDLLEAKTHGAPEGRIPVDFTRLRIPLHPAPKSGPRSVPFEEATVAQIRAATRHLTKPGSARGKRSPVERAIALAIAKGPLAQVSVTLRNGRVSITNVPVESLAHLRAALGTVKLPVSV